MDTIFNTVIVNQIIMGFAGLVALTAVGLSVYFVVKVFISDYKYKKFSLPTEDDFLIKTENEDQKIINPIEESRFVIAEETGNPFIDESRRAAERYHQQVEEARRIREKEHIRKMKKEIDNNSKKSV